MKNKRIQLIVLMSLFLLLLIVFFSIKLYHRKEAEMPVENEEYIELIDADVSAVVAFSYDWNGELCSFEKEGDTWYVKDDHSLMLKQYRISTMLSSLIPMKASQVIENVTDLEQYGLLEPTQTITVDTPNASYLFYVGEQNELTGSNYLKMSSGNTVYVVDSSLFESIRYSVDELLEEQETEEETDHAEDNQSDESEEFQEAADSPTEETSDAAIDETND